MMRFAAEDEIDRFLAEFEAGTIPRAQWTHRAHVAVAAAYVWSDPAAALARMRNGILHLNRCHQTANTADAGYHETLTVFWISILRAFCLSRRDAGRLGTINAAMDELPAGLHRDYYGFDVVKSRRARERWVEPDRRPLPEDGLPS